MDNMFVHFEKNIYLIDLYNFDLEKLLDEYLILRNELMINYVHDVLLNKQLQLKICNKEI